MLMELFLLVSDFFENLNWMKSNPADRTVQVQSSRSNRIVEVTEQ